MPDYRYVPGQRMAVDSHTERPVTSVNDSRGVRYPTPGRKRSLFDTLKNIKTLWRGIHKFSKCLLSLLLPTSSYYKIVHCMLTLIVQEAQSKGLIGMVVGDAEI